MMNSKHYILFGGVVMKKMVVRLVLTVACMGLGVAFADDMQMKESQKDECLLISKNCKNESLSIQEKMEKLNAEIKKGKRIYTAEELKKLENKMKETEEMLDVILSGP
jgi:flagellar motility protein MotE (MotC chaperone)